MTFEQDPHCAYEYATQFNNSEFGDIHEWIMHITL